MTMNKLKVSCAAAALMLSTAQTAFATNTTTTITVTASVVAACSSLNASPIAFGNLTPAQSVSTTGIINVLCSNGTPYVIDLDAGQGGAGAAGRWEMSATAGVFLNYWLYKDAAHNNIWGTATGGSAASGIGSGSGQSLTVYAVTNGFDAFGAPAALGNYTDTVTVTLSF